MNYGYGRFYALVITPESQSILLYNIFVISEGLHEREFFYKNTLQVAREILGARLVRVVDGERLSGIIVETEAYQGEQDLGCHARAGRTPRTQVMYGPPGHVYVYFTYGVHWMLNFVTEREDYPAAILIRSVIPVEGLDYIAMQREGRPRSEWTNGPAKLCQAFNITGAENGLDICQPGGPIWVERNEMIPDSSVTNSPRVGLNNVPEPWKSILWRFRVSKEFFLD
jgi:DNA-3-methyladenine glycosylase